MHAHTCERMYMWVVVIATHGVCADAGADHSDFLAVGMWSMELQLYKVGQGSTLTQCVREQLSVEVIPRRCGWCTAPSDHRNGCMALVQQCAPEA